MAGYIIVYANAKKIIVISVVVTLFLITIGIITGYFSGRHSINNKGPSSSVAEALRTECSDLAVKTPSGKIYFDRYVERHSEKQACVSRPEDCWNFGLPRNYIAYHLNGKSVKIDGKLDDEAWTEVPWSEYFVDMRSTAYPKPYLDTRFKIRWDDERMYIGAYIQETNLWATITTPDDDVWKENGFEFLMDVDGSLFNYKQVQINVLGTMMDMLLYKSPWDFFEQQDFVKTKLWNPDAFKGVFTEGTVNTPGDTDKYWSVELSLSFAKLAESSQRSQSMPNDSEVWFIQFGRSESKLTVTNGVYQVVNGSDIDWWSWQPCDALNLHLQDRWGLVQFKRNIMDKDFRFEKWHIYKALFDTMEATKQYKAINGRYTNAIEELDLPPYLLARTCVEIPDITLKWRNETNFNPDPVQDFDITIKSLVFSHAPGHIRSDRYVSFG